MKANYNIGDLPRLRRLRSEHLTKPSDLVEADESAAREGEGFVDVGAPLIADGEAAEAIEPSERALDNPAVSAQPLARLHASSCNPGRDGAGATLLAAATVIVGFVRMELLRAPAGSTSAVPHARHGVERCGQHEAVVAIGRAQADPEERTLSVDHKMALRARFAAIRRVRAGLSAPFFAGTDALSKLARLQSSCPASERRSSSTRCSAA